MPAQYIAPAHIAHGSVLVYTAADARTSALSSAHARRTKLVSAWPVQSPVVTTLFSASTKTFPSASASSAPKGWLPCSRDRRATSMARRISSVSEFTPGIASLNHFFRGRQRHLIALGCVSLACFEQRGRRLLFPTRRESGHRHCD